MPLNKKILIITYYWPPCGGAGVQRWLKFTKYLPDYGWEPIVLTVDPEYAQYPAIDQSLENDIHPSLKIYKTKALNYFMVGKAGRSGGKPAVSANFDNNSVKNRIARFIRGNFFIPDPRKGWDRYAIRRAAEVIRKEEIKYLVTTSPPHSSQLIGLKMKKLFPDITWICDLRDPWTDIYYYRKFYGTWPARMYDRMLEKKVLRHADKIITVGKSLAELYSLKLGGVKEKLTVITNGYDEEDFIDISSRKDTGKTTITYVGSLTEQYPVSGFLKALFQLYPEGKLKNLKVRFIGNISRGIRLLLNSSPLASAIELIPYADHRQAIEYMVDSTILLMIIPDYRNNDTIITGKLYEYLRSQRIILCIGPPGGDAAGIINEMKSGYTINDSDIDSIKSFIHKYSKASSLLTDCSKYSHRNLAKNLSEILV